MVRNNSEERIKQALIEGKSYLEIIKEFNTHSQRIVRIKKEMTGELYKYQNLQKDRFLMDAY